MPTLPILLKEDDFGAVPLDLRCLGIYIEDLLEDFI